MSKKTKRGVVIEVLPYIAYAYIRLWIPIAVKDETSVVRGFDAVQSLLGGVGQRESPIRAWLVLFNWLKQAGISFNQWQQVTCLLIVSLYPVLPKTTSPIAITYTG